MRIEYRDVPEIYQEYVKEGAVGITFDAPRDTNTYCRLVELAVQPGDIVVDLGCGSGIPTIHAVRQGAQASIGVDCEADAVRITRQNAGLAEPSGKVHVIEADMVDFLSSEVWRTRILQRLKVSPARLDLVMSNPPYIPVARGAPASIDGGGDGLRYIRPILEHGSRLADKLAWQQGSYSTPLVALKTLVRMDMLIESVVAHAARFGPYSLEILPHLEQMRDSGDAFFWTSPSDDSVPHWYLVMGFVARRRAKDEYSGAGKMIAALRAFLDGFAAFGLEYLSACDLDLPFQMEVAVYPY